MIELDSLSRALVAFHMKLPIAIVNAIQLCRKICFLVGTRIRLLFHMKPTNQSQLPSMLFGLKE